MQCTTTLSFIQFFSFNKLLTAVCQLLKKKYRFPSKWCKNDVTFITNH